MQPATTIIQDPLQVDARLADLGVTLDELRAIVRSAVAARNDAVPNDPSNAGGWMAYCYGTRKLRDIFCPRKWKLDRTDGVESVVNPTTGVKLVYQNAQSAGDISRDPRSVSAKGEASKQLVNWVNGDLFRGWPDQNKRPDSSVWYLFVDTDGEYIGAELSRPQSIEGGQFKGFSERIIIVVPGNDNGWEDLALPDEDIDEQEFTVNVTRK
jgi:hypothetical protein